MIGLTIFERIFPHIDAIAADMPYDERAELLAGFCIRLAEHPDAPNLLMDAEKAFAAWLAGRLVRDLRKARNGM